MSIFWRVMLVGVLLGLVLVQPTRSESPPCQGGDGADVIEPSEVYRVGPGDILQVTVHDTKDLRRTLATVQHGGDISFPLLGKIPVSGLSIAEVQDRLEELLSKDSPGNPQIEVKMKEYRSQWVAVSGEVARPGKYYLTGRKTLHELLTEAGGLTGKASGEVAVTRVIGSFEEGTSSRRLWVSRQMLPAEQKRCLALSLVSGDVVRAGRQESATSLTK